MRYSNTAELSMRAEMEILNGRHTTRTLRARILSTMFAAGTLLAITAAPAGAADESASGAWRFKVSPYVWTPGIGGATGAGDFNLGFSDILESVNWLTMGELTASKNKFSVSADLINMKLNIGGNEQFPIPIPPGSPAAVSVGIDASSKAVLKAWVVSPTVRYKLIDKEQASLQVLAGARYLSLDVTATVTASVGAMRRAVQVSDTEDWWDGIVGASGRVYLDNSKHMYFDYYGDVGTGDSDLTWQVQGTSATASTTNGTYARATATFAGILTVARRSPTCT